MEIARHLTYLRTQVLPMQCIAIFQIQACNSLSWVIIDGYLFIGSRDLQAVDVSLESTARWRVVLA